MAAGWTDQHGGLRACRARLRERYPVLTSSTLASALGFHPTWYSRVESGKAGLPRSQPNRTHTPGIPKIFA